MIFYSTIKVFDSDDSVNGQIPVPLHKIGCTSTIKQTCLFCIVLGFHYLCTDFRAALGLVRRMGKPSGAVSINPKR